MDQLKEQVVAQSQTTVVAQQPQIPSNFEVRDTCIPESFKTPSNRPSIQELNPQANRQTHLQPHHKLLEPLVSTIEPQTPNSPNLSKSGVHENKDQSAGCSVQRCSQRLKQIQAKKRELMDKLRFLDKQVKYIRHTNSNEETIEEGALIHTPMKLSSLENSTILKKISKSSSSNMDMSEARKQQQAIILIQRITEQKKAREAKRLQQLDKKYKKDAERMLLLKSVQEEQKRIRRLRIIDTSAKSILQSTIDNPETLHEIELSLPLTRKRREAMDSISAKRTPENREHVDRSLMKQKIEVHIDPHRVFPKSKVYSKVAEEDREARHKMEAEYQNKSGMYLRRKEYDTYNKSRQAVLTKKIIFQPHKN